MNARPSIRLRGQRGGIAIVVAIALVALVAAAGIGMDIGRLYVNKTKLQTAADACALAAGNELVCDPTVGTCPMSYLQNAQAAGITVAGRNRMDATNANGGSSVVIDPSDVRFSTTLAPNSGYLSIAGGANPNSRYAMCIARAGGITPWLMGIVGAGPQSVGAMAVAVTAPSQSFCNTAPLGICTSAAAPTYGLNVGDWISSPFHSTGNNDSFPTGAKLQWIDFTPTAGGNSEINNQLVGTGAACNLKVGQNVQQQGQQQGAKAGYNTRFGIYQNGANAYTPQTAPPDRTGYAYPNKSPGSPVINNDPTSSGYNGRTAYSDYRTRQAANATFDSSQYGGTGNFSGNSTSSANLKAYGSERRLVAVPIVNCSGGSTAPVRAMACALMLNPMSNGSNGTVYLEYRGLANSANSPCRASGVPGAGGGGPDVPTLVQ